MFHRAIAVAAGVFAATVATAQTDVPFALDWKFEGPSAAYFAAIDNGHFDAEGPSNFQSSAKGTFSCAVATVAANTPAATAMAR